MYFKQDNAGVQLLLRYHIVGFFFYHKKKTGIRMKAEFIHRL